MTASNPDAGPESEPANTSASGSTGHAPAEVARFTRIRSVDWVQLGVLLCCSLVLLVIWLHYRPS